MILLHSNVLSALMRKAGEPAVERWLDAQPVESAWTTTVLEHAVGFCAAS